MSQNIYSQSKYFGYVKDFDNHFPINANIFLKSSNTNNILFFGITDDKGYYELTTNKPGKYILTFSSLNYISQSIDIDILNDTQIIEKNINLIIKPYDLQNVTIKSERPIIIKKDTIIYNTKYFLQGNELVVEDLLRKIPGLSIDESGIIKIGNQEIEKVMIDGDDFFEKGYKLLTKNMPVNPIDKIELYLHYSNNKHLKDIEKSNKIALNLKLKNDYKRQWFGNTSLGNNLISDNRYEYRGNLMNFGKKNKFYNVFNFNNIGENSFGEIENLIRPFSSDNIETIGDNQNISKLINSEFESPNLKQSRINFNNSKLVSFNSIFTLSSNVKIKTLGLLLTDKNDFIKNNFQSFSFDNTTFKNSENFIGKKNYITAFGKVDFSYDISTLKTIKYIGKFNKSNENYINDLIFNGNLINENLINENKLFDQLVTFTNNYQKNKVFILSFRHIKEYFPQNYSINPILHNNLFNTNANNIVQNSKNNMNFIGIDGHLINRNKNSNILDIQFGNQIRIDDLISNYYLKINDNIITEPHDFQNNLSYKTNDLYLFTKYHFNFKKINLLTQVDFHQFFNSLTNFSNQSLQSPFYLNPKFGINWSINKKNSFTTNYSFNKSNSNIIDIYSNYIQTSFNSFSKGTDNFNQLNSSSLSLNYIYGNLGDKIFLNSSLNFSKDNDFISTNTIIEQNYSRSIKILIKDKSQIIYSLNIDRYIKPISSNLKFNFGISNLNFKNIVNNSDLRIIKNNSFNSGFQLRSGFQGIFNYNIGSKWNFNEIKTFSKNYFTNNQTFLDLYFILNNKFNVKLETERYYFGNLEKNYNLYYFMDIEARYDIIDNKLAFTLSGKNLFNSKIFRNYSISDVFISQTEYKLLPRFLLLKIDYRF